MVSAPPAIQPVSEPAEPESRRAAILEQLRHLVLQLRYLVLAAAAAAIWATSLRGVNPGAMNDLGLISVLPWPAWLAFGLLTVGFIACWRRADQLAWLLVVHVVLLVVMLYGLPVVITHGPSGPIVFRHAGITETLIRTRTVNTRIDAYFSWPGFFMGLASLVKLAGTPSALSFATWGTVAFNLLYLPPLLLVVRALTRDARLVWGTVWLFYTANWINQDYLAPQAFGYIFYLTILGLLLTYLRPRGGYPGRESRLLRRSRALLRVRPAEVQLPELTRWAATAVITLVVLFYATTVASHQLTPFAILLSVAALVVIGECTARRLPLLMAVMLTLWVLFVAHSYIYGHFAHLIGGLGDLTKATSANLTARINGSTQHLLVIRERLLLSGVLWLLALIGGVRRFRSGHADHAAAVLCLAPLPLFALQPYGGEMLLRIYFFMLPFAAFFAIAALLPGRRPTGAARAQVPGRLRAAFATTAFGLTIVAVLFASLVALYGNQRVDYFTSGERAAISFVYEHALPGSTFAVEQPYLPWKYTGYDQYHYLSIDSMLGQPHPPSPAQALARFSKALRPSPGHPAGFVIVTRSQHVYVETFGGLLSQGYLVRFERLLGQSPQFRLVYFNSDARIYLRLPG